MKYFIDTEFIEGFTKPFLWPLFGKNRHFIDLISIGIICEDGREYYAISKNFNPKDADKWVKENVIAKLPDKHFSQFDSPRIRSEAMQWKYQNLITAEVADFFGCEYDNGFWGAPNGIEVYGYYADYDWVLFCSLFGRMIDLPKGFPMFCIDLKQMLDEKANGIIRKGERYFAQDFNAALKILKQKKDYPAQEDEHNALADAKWNKKLFDFINSL